VSFISSTIVPLAAAGVGGNTYFIAKYDTQTSFTYQNSLNSKVETIVNLEDDTVGIWQGTDGLIYTNDNPAAYARVNWKTGELVTFKNYSSGNGSFRSATYSAHLDLQIVMGNFLNGASLVQGVAALDKDGDFNNTSHILTNFTFKTIVTNPNSANMFTFNSNRIHSLTYDTSSGWTINSEQQYSRGGSFRTLSWNGSYLWAAVNINSSTTSIQRFNASSSATSVSSILDKDEPDYGSVNQNYRSQAPSLITQEDGSNLVLISDKYSRYIILKYDGTSMSNRYHFYMNQSFTYNSNTTTCNLRQVMIDRSSQNNYVYGIGRIRWRPPWAVTLAGSDWWKYDRGSILITQHNASNLTLNKAIAISLYNSSGTSSNYAGTDTGFHGDSLAAYLLNDDADLMVSIWGNNGTINRQDQSLFAIKIPTDFTALTMGVYNNWKFEDITSILNSNASPSTGSTAPYVRSGTMSTASAPTKATSSATNMSSRTMTETLVEI